MKKLNVNQMEDLIGGVGGFGTGLSCTVTAFALGAIIGGATLGLGAFAFAVASAGVCGGSIGWGSASGSWF